ncbi:MAG: glycoside hydrolase N-terminal domain-containing protein [Mediterraneibacter faecis]
MRTALATVNYDYEGVHYTREYFNSYPDNVMAVRLSADQERKDQL